MNIQSASSSSIRHMGASSHSVLYLDAPPGVSQETWDEAKLEERLALMEASANNERSSPDNFWGTHGSQIGGTALGTAPVMLSESRKIFTDYPAKLSVEWEFTRSPFNDKNGPSTPLSEKLNEHGIKHDKKKINKAPVNSDMDRSKGIGKLNNTNGALAEAALAEKLEKNGYHVDRQVTIKTPLGERRLDIVATKNEGSPYFSENRLVESKQGYQSLPQVAKDNNILSQIEKDAAILTEHKTKAPIPQAVGRILHAVGHVARPVGVVLGALEINQAYQADGNRIGVHTAEKIASVGGAAGGGFVGATGGVLLGAAAGSFVPVFGTAVGAVVGGLGIFAGGIGGGMLGEYAASGIFSKVKHWFFPQP